MKNKRIIFSNLKGYKHRWIRSDFMAALVVTAIAVPESLGFAVIVGLPIQTGLYCALIAPIVFAALTSSKRLIVGADSATAALVATGGATIAVAGTAAYGNAIAVLGLLTAAVLLAMSIARLGFLANLISRPVLIGFISGVGVQLLVGKLPEMLGFHAEGGLIEKLSYTFTHLAQANLATSLLSLAVVAVIILGWKFRWPGALLALALATVATKLFDLHAFGIGVVGVVPAGLPAFHLPTITLPLMSELLPVAFSIAIVILAQSLAVIRSAAAQHNEKVNDNKDLMALGFANAASATIGGFAINGSPPRTSASEVAGGRSQLVNVMMAGLIGIILVFATGLFEFVPAACLAAVVFTIGLHLIKLRELRDIFIVRHSEFAIAIVSLGGVAFLGVQKGVMIAVGLSLIDRLRRQYHPRDEILVRDGSFTDWASDRLAVTKKQLDAPAGVLVYRFDDALFFENASYFLTRVTEVIKASSNPVRCLILDAGAISDIDYTAAQMLKRLYSQLDSSSIQLVIAHVSPHLRTLLKRYELTKLLGSEHVYSSVSAAIEAYESDTVTHSERIRALSLKTREYVVISGTAMELMGIRKTNDVDLVVSRQAYKRLQGNGWKEYVQDDGKCVLSHHGYKIMTQWMGHDLSYFQKNSHIVEDVPVISLTSLIDCKQQMGRVKDRKDVELIRNFTMHAKV